MSSFSNPEKLQFSVRGSYQLTFTGCQRPGEAEDDGHVVQGEERELLGGGHVHRLRDVDAEREQDQPHRRGRGAQHQVRPQLRRYG